MLKKSKINTAVLLALGVVAALPVMGQDANQRVEITGSSIRSIAGQTSLPITTLKADDLAKAGVTSAEQAIQFIASNQSSVTSTVSVGASNGGAAFADLRGLGAARTLVLVNGKRMVNNPYNGGTSAVDVNTIPYGAVDRVEVLNDGASAIYGSDAVAGVINFITRKEYKGITVNSAITEPTTSGGGKNYDLGVTAGVGSLNQDKWNLFGGLSYRKQDPLAATDRDFSKTAFIPARGVNKTSGTTFPGNYVQSGVTGNFNPSLPGCNTPSSIPSGGICRFDYVPFINTIPEQEQLSAIVKGSYAVNKDNTVALEYVQSNNTLSSKISPTPLTGNRMPATNPYFPGGVGGTAANSDPLFNKTADISVGWRQTSLGGRASESENKTNRILLDWQGSFQNWDYSVAAMQSKSDVTNTFTGGYVNRAGVRAGLAGTGGAPWLNPFGAQTADGQTYLTAQQVIGQVQSASGKLQGVKGEVSGEIYKMPAGPLTMAVGLEYYKDSVEYLNNFALIRQAASSGLDLAEDANGSRNWTGVSAEFNIPVVKNLDINLAARWDNYSDFGSTFNPKASFRWTPTKELLMRGSINTGFRAPSLYEYNGPAFITNTGNPWDDPVLCAGGTVNAAAGGVKSRDCGQQFNSQQSGNSKLKPETSTAWGLGLVFQPTAASTLSVDYWNYTVKDSIGVLSDEVIFGNPIKYAPKFVRCSQVSAAVAATLDNCGIPGGDPLGYVIQQTINLGTYKTTGVDFAAGWRSEATSYGRFSANWQATYVLSYEYQLASGEDYNNNLGTYFNGNPISRYRQLLNFGWQMNAWSANLLNHYSRGYNDQNAVAAQYTNTVGSINTWDIAGTWTGVKGVSLTAGVTNLFNQAPPFSNQGGGFQVGYDYRYGNPIGRALLLRGVYSF